MKSISIKGKDYIEVNERIKHFRAIFQGYRLVSDIIQLDDKICVIKARVLDPAGNEVSTGIAREVNGSTYINKTSYVENCETSAWGRALGNFGIGIDTSIASAEEVQNAISNQNGNGKKEKPKPEPPENDIDKITGDAFMEFSEKNKDAVAEGFCFSLDKFKEELRNAFKKKPKPFRDKFVKNADGIANLAEKIKPEDVIEEIK